MRPADPNLNTRQGPNRIMRSGIPCGCADDSEAIMHPTTTVSLLLLALALAAPAHAWDGRDGEPALRLPGEPGVQVWPAVPALKLRHWATDLSDRLLPRARPSLPAVQWRGEGASRPSLQSDAPVLVERTRTVLTAHWRPWTVGSWKLGAAMGYHQVLPRSNGSPGLAAMPMASYEQPGYRVNLGLVPPSGERRSAVVLGLNVPLH